MKARFMIERAEIELEDNPGCKLWCEYPFEVDGVETWIPRDDLTDQQLTEIAEGMYLIGERKQREAEALSLYRRVKLAGISGIIDGSKGQ